MGFLTNMLAQIGQQQNAPAQPALGNLLKTTPSQPAPFQRSSAPWQSQLAGAIDYSTAGGDAWNTIGRDGVINYMGDSLMKRYGTNNLSDFRYIEDANTPGGYKLDWAGRQPVTGFLGGIKDASRSKGITLGNAGSEGGGDPMMTLNPSDNLSFGATWEGEGGTTFSLYRKPDGSVGVKTGSAQSNETGDIIAALAILGGGYMAGTGALGGAAAGGAAEGAAAAGAAEGAAAGAAGSSTAAMGAGAADIGMAGFGQFGIPSAIPAGAGYGSLGATALSAPVSTFGAGFGGGAIGSGLAGSLAAGAGGLGGGGGGATSSMGASGGSGGATAGTPPPANPYHPASYLDATNLKNLAGSAMSNFSWTDLIGPGLQLVNGYMSSEAAEDASNDQLQAAREAAARFEPWRQAGAWGVGRAATMLGKEGPEAALAAFAVDPGYQWRVEKGENALTRAAAARGLLGSGKFLKDAMRFNQGEASQEFGNAYNRLTNLAGLGQTATQSSADYLTQGANAQAAGRVGSANAWGNALSQGYSMYANQQQRNQNNALMNRVFGGY
jgi:hypothetical protein